MVSAVCVVAVSMRTRRLVIGPRGRIDIYMRQDGRPMRYGMGNWQIEYRWIYENAETPLSLIITF